MDGISNFLPITAHASREWLRLRRPTEFSETARPLQCQPGFQCRSRSFDR